jgi:hypothetical protein
MALIIELAFYLLMEVIVYGLGRVSIFIFTLGHVRAENAKEIISMNNQGYAERDSKIVVPAMVAKILGVAVLTALFMLYSSYKAWM